METQIINTIGLRRETKEMKPIVIVYSFNEAYAELAAASMTSLVYNTKRNCHIHILQNGISEGTLDKILRLEAMYPNAKIIIHRIPEERFEEIADWIGKEVWYRLLIPEILIDCDKALSLDADTIVCRDIAELYDMDLDDCYAAVNTFAPSLDEYDLTSPYYYHGDKNNITTFNMGVILYNLKAIRDKDLFNMQTVIETVKTLKKAHTSAMWLWEQSLQSYIFERENLKYLESKYNSHIVKYKLLDSRFLDIRYNFDEMYESICNPVIIHYNSGKPNAIPNFIMYDHRFLKWWDYHAISPFSDPENDKQRLKAIIEHAKRFKDVPLNMLDYRNHCLFDDLMDASEKLKEFNAAGVKVIIYGAGVVGTKIIRLLKFNDVKIYKICDILKRGKSIDGIKIDAPEILKEFAGNAVVAIAIEEPRIWTDVVKMLTDMGYPKNHILPLFEQLAVGGRKCRDVLAAVTP